MSKFWVSAWMAVLGLSIMGTFFLGCEEHSENIPTGYPTISTLMEQGWAQYAAGDFQAARQTFFDASSRIALYLPAYNGLGWCAVRLTDFPEAEIKFSFITTLADAATQADLLADTYAGLSLSAAIHRSVAEISGSGDLAFWQSLAYESIQYADSVFDLLGEDYDPADHDPTFGSQSLHLLNAQNYFYLQEYGASEAELGVVDPDFIPGQLALYSGSDTATVDLGAEETINDTSWYPLQLQPTDSLNAPISAGLHDYIEITPPDSLAGLIYSIDYAQNRILVMQTPSAELEPGMDFVVSYVYLNNYAAYLYDLIEHIEELIEF